MKKGEQNFFRMMRMATFLLIVAFIIMPVTGFSADKQVKVNDMSQPEGESTESAEQDKEFIISPTFQFTGAYESNYYKEPSDEIGVYTYLFQPGFALKYSTAKSLIEMGYSMNIYEYDADDDIPSGWNDPSEDDYVGHTFNLKSRTKPLKKLTIGLDERYSKTRDSSEYDAFSNDLSREKYYINQLTPMVEYQATDRLMTRVSYRNTIVSYDELSTEDAIEHRGMLDTRYQFWLTAGLGLEYQYWERDYDFDIYDYSAHQIDLVVRKEAKFLYLEGAVGYQDRDYESEDREDGDTVTARGAVSWQSSGLDEGKPKTYATLTLLKNFTDSGVDENYADFTEVNLKAGHTILDRILADVEGFYRYADYQDYTPDREDDMYGIAGALSYQMTRWLTFQVKGGWEERDSNLSEYDYDNAYLMFTVGTAYPFTLY